MVALLTLPPGWGGEGEENGKKLVGWDKGTLTETAKEANSNNNNTEKKEYTK